MCDANDESEIYKYWSRDIQCSPSYGKCDFITQSCVCHEGFAHDLSFSRIRSCQVPELYFPILFGIQLSLNILVIPYVLINYRQSKAMARLSLQLNLAASFAYLLYNVLNFVYEFKANAVLIYTFHVNIAFLGAIKYVEIYSFVSPLTAAAMKPVAPIKKLLFGIFIFFKSTELIPLLIASIKYADSSDLENDIPWSKCLFAFSFASGLEGVTVVLFFMIYARRMLQFIDGLSSEKKNSENYSRTPESYIKKVRLAVLRLSLTLPFVAFMLFFAPMVYFVTGYLPGSYLLTSLSASASAPMILSSVMYASNAKVVDNSSQQPGQNKISSKRFDNQVVQYDQQIKQMITTTKVDTLPSVQGS